MQNHAVSWSFSRSDCNGKEKDWESGFHLPRRGFEHLGDKYNAVKNYGARYYWSEILTSFISIDRYADKYPFISPYAYCAWSPTGLTDPSGDSIRLNGMEEQRQRILDYLHQYSNLTFQCDEKGYLSLNTELPGSEVKTRTDKYIEEMINNPDNICVIEIMETDHERMQRGNPTLFGGTIGLQRDNNGNITWVEGVQYLNINRLGNSCGLDDESKKYPGRIIMHEFSEGFEGCLLARKLNRKLEINNTDYNMAHAKATGHFWAEFERGTNGKMKLKSEHITW